jgi:hypothetical protein
MVLPALYYELDRERREWEVARELQALRRLREVAPPQGHAGGALWQRVGRLVRGGTVVQRGTVSQQ